MKATYKTLHHGSAPIIGVKHYIKEIEIDGEVIDTKVSPRVPCTNRGTEKEHGWLGSFSSGGVTKDRYSRGLCEVVSVDEIGENHYEIVWSPVV
jgi:hypothetical protein